MNCWRRRPCFHRCRRHQASQDRESLAGPRGQAPAPLDCWEAALADWLLRLMADQAREAGLRLRAAVAVRHRLGLGLLR